MRRRGAWLGSLLLAAAVASVPAHAFRIELKDVAPDRIERQRAEAIGMLPLPGTPNVAQLTQRLADKGLAAGSAVFIRVFKAESELEVWMQKGDRFELLGTYPICHWSGTLGPKISEGDKQSPEGVYTVSLKQLHMIGRHPRSLNLGFPNALDRQFQRTGSYILIHGGCGSVGCFAMTNPVIEEIFSLTQAALKNGQETVHVHAFPFRLTEDKLQAYALNEWYDFWRNLKDVYDSFDRTKRLPKVSVCEGRYWVEAAAGGEVAPHSPLAVCGISLAADSPNSETETAAETGLTWTPKGLPPLPLLSRATPILPLVLPQPRSSNRLSPPDRRPLSTTASRLPPAPSNGPSPPTSPTRTAAATRVASAAPQLPTISGMPSRFQIPCNTTLASCRKWVALQTVIHNQRIAKVRAGLRVAQRR